MSVFNRLVVATLPLIPKRIIQTVARRYIAGPHLVDAVATTTALMKVGATSTIDVLGEFVENRDRAVSETAMAASVLDAIADNNLASYLSVKLTSLGLDIDHDFAYANVRSLVDRARLRGLFVRMDMENTPYTDVTLDFYRRLRRDGYDNVGVVIQAYLRRSESDIRSLLEFAPSIRLCKGIYVEDVSVAYKDADEIRANYRKLLRILVEGGARPHIATHDEQLIKDAENLIASQKLNPTAYEFQMLLGVREDRRDTLLKAGHAVRIYVPFGEDWYGYSTRRLKENPQVAGYVAKAVLTGK
ncbi:MAG TPA: L-proline dehydrogenase [Bacteroidetes bacterium]|nr:L-proline dehydrogenase [Bacteroidota bacterium]HRK04897.1 proline dehydrogenase family protein [Chlorobiota bacterium]